MKKNNYKVFILGLVMAFILSFGLQAQNAWINSMSIIPSQPATNNQVFLVVNASFTSGSCEQAVQYTTLFGNLINIQAGHNLGPLAYICTSIDTIPIGQLAAGSYSVLYNLSVNGQTVTDSLSFTVIHPTGMHELNGQIITLYPNPASDYIKIMVNEEQIPNDITLIDQNGRLIPTNFLNLNQGVCKELFLDIKPIQNGIYYLLINTDINTTVKKLIIQH